ncbi:MAG: sugar ABC transporter substrate-binding protein, partial [Anaerolineae bacterium]|nr:sugar ABC transporter substrate-binding protein [Anaerolineae bacterium]
QEEVILSFLSQQQNISQQDPLALLMRQFEEENPGVKIAQLTTAAGDDYFTKLVTMTAAKTPPDIFYMPPWNLVYFKDENLLAALDPYVATAADFDIENVPAALVEAYSWDGVLLGLPVLGSILRIWAYNKDAFDEAGVEYPTRYWDYDEFLDKTQKVVKKSGDEVDVWGVDPRLPDNAHLLPWLWTFGGDFYNYPALTACALDTPESIAAMQASVDLIRKYEIQAPPEIGPADLGISFPTGKIGVSAIGTGQWLDPTKPGEFVWPFNWGLIEMPKVVDTQALIHSTGLSLSATSPNRDKAWKLLAFLMSDESQEFYSKAAGTIAATKSIGAKFAFQNIPAEDQQVIADGLEYAGGRARWRTKVWGLSSSNAQQLWSAMWLGEITAEEACRQAAQDTDAMLAEAENS